jgi:alpha-L-fucosidase 2
MGRSYANPAGRSGPENEREIMQMDAGMSCTAAIQEMLLHTRRGVNVVFGGAPRRWRDIRFRRMRTDGAFLVSAERKAARTIRVVVESRHGGTFRVANPWPGTVAVRGPQGEVRTLTGPVLDVPVPARGKVELIPAP